MPAPVSTILRPALSQIALEGWQRGCRVILTGDGADEWVGVNPFMTGDLLRSLDLKGIYQLWCTYSQSYGFPFSTWFPLRRMFWVNGARPLLWDACFASPAGALARRLARTVVPGALESLWRRRMAQNKPAWIIPDPALSAEIDRREMEWWALVP